MKTAAKIWTVVSIIMVVEIWVIFLLWTTLHLSIGVAGAYLLWKDFSPLALGLFVLGLFVAFCVVAFALVPLISRFVGCRNCPTKNDCPWMR